jgi:hypothetical protein
MISYQPITGTHRQECYSKDKEIILALEVNTEFLLVQGKNSAVFLLVKAKVIEGWI